MRNRAALTRVRETHPANRYGNHSNEQRLAVVVPNAYTEFKAKVFDV